MRAKIQRYLVRYRLPFVLLLNCLLIAFGYTLALSLRFDFDAREVISLNRLWLPLSLLVLFRTGTYVAWGLNRGYWRYASTRDLMDIVSAHFVSSVLFFATVSFLRVPNFPRSVVVIEFAVSVLLSGGSRLWVRLLCERYLSDSPGVLSGEEKEVAVLGAGDSGHLLVKFLQNQKRIPYKPVFVLDDSKRLVGSAVYGVKVTGTISSLESCLERHPRVAAVFVAIPSLSRTRLGEVEAVCKSLGVPLKRLQSFEDIACSDSLAPAKGISIESVLEKEMDIEHELEIRKALQDKRVLVTGAGGSIGSELVRQILPFRPKSVVLFDHSEFNLYSVERDLSLNHKDVEKHFILGNIADRRQLSRTFDSTRPEIVFHAAAYKHVPLMEENAFQAFLNNIIGTRNVLEIAATSGVKEFVLISSDKAVDPSSIMGCSKRIAEMLVAESGMLNTSSNGAAKNALNSAVVRFGNVINSAGSVIPLFKKQIAAGGPVTVTHPDMERYFMSIREAVRLVLTAGTLGAGGKIYVLDMGKPIRIVDVAKKMLALYGMRDIPIVYTGIRPGEKLREELTTWSELTRHTPFKKVREVVSTLSYSHPKTFSWTREQEPSLFERSDEQIGEMMKEFVRSNCERRKEKETDDGEKSPSERLWVNLK